VRYAWRVKSRVVTALATLAVLTQAACLRPGVLVAEDGAHRLVARDRQSGIAVVITTAAWDGYPSDLDQEITVLHALVANMGEEAVLLAPGDIELHDVRGFRHELLDAGGSFHRAGDDEASAGSYRSPGRGYDPGRSSDFVTLRAPDRDVHRAALPWGVLEPGTQMRGYLYFEQIENTSNQARLVWHFGTPDHRPIVDLAFDLHVARPRG
jgi:hypothetical protein